MNTYQQWLFKEISAGTPDVGMPVASPAPTSPELTPQALRWYASQISAKLGEKANTYQPLINAIKSKATLLPLFMQLIDELGGMRTSVAGGLQSKFQKRFG